MTIVHIVGKPRQGKGILMTYLGLFVADAGNPVVANYHLDSPAATFFDFYDMLGFLRKPRCEPQRLLLIDELPGWCDSYVTQAKTSRFATHFVNQSAKLGYDLIFTSQRTKRSDINFRELSDFRLKATKDEAGRKFVYSVLDPEEDEDVETGKKFSLSYDLAMSFWSRYDTFEAVPPIGLDEMLVEMQRYDPERMNETIEAQVLTLYNRRAQLGLKPGVRKDEIENALLECRLPLVYSKFVCVRLLKRLLRKEPPLPEKAPSTVEAEATKEDRKLVWSPFRR